MNICFASDNSGIKKLALDNVKGFREVFSPLPEFIDILVLNGDCDVSNYIDSNYSLKVSELKNVNSVISCGMQGLDSVTFSSISDTTALVCIRRRIVFANTIIDPCEFKTPFDSRIGIFHNLVISILDFLTDIKGE